MMTNSETQFDFLLGEWDYTWDEVGKATNYTLRIMDGKAIQETSACRFDRIISAGRSFVLLYT